MSVKANYTMLHIREGISYLHFYKIKWSYLKLSFAKWRLQLWWL